MRTQRRTTTALMIVVTVAGIGLVACGTTTVAKQPAPTTPSQSAPIEPSQSAPAEPTQPEAATSGPVGTSFTITDTDADGTVTAYKIRLDKVVEPAKPDPEYVQYGEPVKAGHHVVGMLFYVEGVKGKIYADPETGLTATGSNGEVYQYSTMELADRAGFESTDLLTGEHRSGWTAFEVPNGTQLVSVRYEPMTASLGDATVTWRIG